MKSEWDNYRRTFYALLSALKSRRTWDEEVIPIDNFVRMLKEELPLLSKKNSEEIKERVDYYKMVYKAEFPPRVHPHHTAEYRRKNYKSRSTHTKEELRHMRTENLRRGYEEYARDPINIAKKTSYLLCLRPMSRDIKLHIQKMNKLDKSSDEYKELDQQLDDMIKTYEEVRLEIKEES